MSDDHGQEQCDTCRFWLHMEGTYGLCRRYPPNEPVYQTNMGGDLVDVYEHRAITSDNWCGEWQQGHDEDD